MAIGVLKEAQVQRISYSRVKIRGEQRWTLRKYMYTT